MAEGPYEVLEVDKTTVAIKYRDGEEEKISRDRGVLHPTEIKPLHEETSGMDGMGAALNYQEPASSKGRITRKDN